MHSDKLFPGSYLVSCTQYFESILLVFLIYACRNYVLLPAKACLSSIRNRTKGMMNVKMASCQTKCIHVELTLELHLVIAAFILLW